MRLFDWSFASAIHALRRRAQEKQALLAEQGVEGTSGFDIAGEPIGTAPTLPSVPVWTGPIKDRP
jgi:hypothetical protein